MCRPAVCTERDETLMQRGSLVRARNFGFPCTAAAAATAAADWPFIFAVTNEEEPRSVRQPIPRDFLAPARIQERADDVTWRLNETPASRKISTASRRGLLISRDQARKNGTDSRRVVGGSL